VSAGNVGVAGDVCASGRVSGRASGWPAQWVVLMLPRLGLLFLLQWILQMVLLALKIVPPAAAAVVVVVVGEVLLGAPAAVVVVVVAAAVVVAANGSVVVHWPQVLGQDNPPPGCRNAKCHSRLSERYESIFAYYPVKHLKIIFKILLL